MMVTKYPNDYSAVKLVQGEGHHGHCGCWMSTLRAATVPRTSRWSDECPTVSPVIATLCININDCFCTVAARTRAILQFGLTRPVNSVGNAAVECKRAGVFYTWLLREHLPFVLTKLKLPVASALRELPAGDPFDFQAAALAMQQVVDVVPAKFKYSLQAIKNEMLHGAVKSEHTRIAEILDYVRGMLRSHKFFDQYTFPEWDELTAEQYLVVLDRMLAVGNSSAGNVAPVYGFDEFYNWVGTEPTGDDADDDTVSE